VALWISTSVTTGPGAPLRFAALSVLGLMAARMLTPSEPPAVVTALAAIALSVAASAGVAATSPGPAVYVLAAMVAVGISLIPVRGAHGA
jgi:di/tricarboxylate transporter